MTTTIAELSQERAWLLQERPAAVIGGAAGRVRAIDARLADIAVEWVPATLAGLDAHRAALVDLGQATESAAARVRAALLDPTLRVQGVRIR